MRNLRRLEKKYQDDINQLSEQLSREEESVTVLRRDIANKDELIENLRKNSKEVRSYMCVVYVCIYIYIYLFTHIYSIIH